MACRPPIAPKSIPYWNGLIDTRVHAARHFQFSKRPEPVDASGIVMEVVVILIKRYHNKSFQNAGTLKEVK